MDKQIKNENNLFFSSSSILISNRNKGELSYEDYIKEKKPKIQNEPNNNISSTDLPNRPFLMNMNGLYYNMLRYNFFNKSFPYNNSFTNQFNGNRINSLLQDFNNELKEEYEKEKANESKEVIENKNNIYNFTPLIKKLESQEDERFSKSRFLKFIKDINSKKLIINEEKNIIEENPHLTDDNKNENEILETNINELEELLNEAIKYMNYNREDLALNTLEKISDNILIKKENNKKYLLKTYMYLIICHLNNNEELLSISFIIDLLNLIKDDKHNESTLTYDKEYLAKDFIDKINRRDFDILNKEEYEKYEYNKTKIKKETENYIKYILMTNNNEEYNEMLLLIFGLILYLNENYTEAEGAFNQLIMLNEKNYFYYNILGVINANQKKYEEAEKCYKKALNINSKYPKGLINYGVLLSNQGKIKESCKYIISALKIFDDIPEGWNLLLSNIIELDEDDLICEINDRNLMNIENSLFNNKLF